MSCNIGSLSLASGGSKITFTAVAVSSSVLLVSKSKYLSILFLNSHLLSNLNCCVSNTAAISTLLNPQLPPLVLLACIDCSVKLSTYEVPSCSAPFRPFWYYIESLWHFALFHKSTLTFLSKFQSNTSIRKKKHWNLLKKPKLDRCLTEVGLGMSILCYSLFYTVSYSTLYSILLCILFTGSTQNHPWQVQHSLWYFVCIQLFTQVSPIWSDSKLLNGARQKVINI